MHGQRKSTLELGGMGGGMSSPTENKTVRGLSSIQSIHLPSRQLIGSAHRLPQKLSPNKHRIQIERNTNGHGIFQNQHYNDMQQSKLTVLSKLQRMLESERSSRAASPNRISLTYSNGPLTPVNRSEALSPNKMVGLPRQAQLQRKLQILEGRVGELHRQKQIALTRLNEENRRIYHQNTTLKSKVNQLCKALERTQKMSDLASSERTEVTNQSLHLDNQTEVDCLKREIMELEDSLAMKEQKLQELALKNQQTKTQMAKLTTLCENQLGQIKQLNQYLTQQSKQNEQNKKAIIELKNQSQHWQQLKLNQDEELEEIRHLCSQNQERAAVMLKQYQNGIEAYQNKIRQYQSKIECFVAKTEDYQHKMKTYENKIEEYCAAYNHNQELICQLELQLQQYSSVIPQEAVEESAVNHDVVGQCRELQDNLLQAMQERESTMQKLKIENDELAKQIGKNKQNISTLKQQNAEKTRQLLHASELLQNVTVRFEQLEERYTILQQQYERQKAQKGSVNQKCKKCDQLLKTVLRLNSYINPKKVQ